MSVAEDLPVIADVPADETALPQFPVRPPVPAWKLVLTLAGAGALAGLLLVLVFQATQPRILAHKRKVLEAAVLEVLGQPDGFDELYVVDGKILAEPPAGTDARTLDRVYLGWRGDHEPVGFAVPSGKPGFQDVIRLIFGYDPATGQVLGMKVLESKETPGLGDKIEKDAAFVGQFATRRFDLSAAAPALKGVKWGESSGDEQVDMITGATISSRCVISIINEAVERLGPPLAEYRSQEAPR